VADNVFSNTGRMWYIRSREEHSTDTMDFEVMMKTLTDAYEKMQQTRGSVTLYVFIFTPPALRP